MIAVADCCSNSGLEAFTGFLWKSFSLKSRFEHDPLKEASIDINKRNASVSHCLVLFFNDSVFFLIHN